MKKIISFILGLVMCISLTSCVTTAYSQTEDDVNVIITHGVPYYDSNGLLLYYVYRDLFYYPYYYNGWHFRHYDKPLHPRYHRPIPRNFYHTRPHHSVQPRGGMRPMTPRSSTRTTVGGGRHGHFSRGR